MQSIIIATTKSWNIKNFHILKKKYEQEYTFHLITSSEDLAYEYIKTLKPKYIFFPHWSWIIPESIYKNFTCVVFHMTDLPYGRGGSPLQNLLVRGVYHTKISALKVEKGLDSGDIYLKEDLEISTGSAKTIYQKASNIIFNTMIPKLLSDTLEIKPQVGEVTIFKRRTPNESSLHTLENPTLQNVYDFIRMLDAPDYAKAFLQIGSFKIEFSNADFSREKIIGTFEVKNVN